MAVDDALELPVALGRHDRVTWDGGLVRRVKVLAKDRARIAELAPLWSESRVRELAELVVTFRTRAGLAAIADLAGAVPTSVRSLVLGDLDEMYVEDMTEAYLLDSAPPLIAALPHLESVALRGPLKLVGPERISALFAGEIQTIAHPELTTLSFATFGGELWPALLTISVTALPALRRLELLSKHFDNFAPLCGTLATAGWLGQLTELALTGPLVADAVAMLAHGLGGRRLARLEVTATPSSPTLREQLARLCDELLCPDAPAPEATHARGELWVEHANKPEWGRGYVVRRFDEKVEVEFPGVGTKVFKATAPFLRFGP